MKKILILIMISIGWVAYSQPVATPPCVSGTTEMRNKMLHGCVEGKWVRISEESAELIRFPREEKENITKTGFLGNKSVSIVESVMLGGNDAERIVLLKNKNFVPIAIPEEVHSMGKIIYSRNRKHFYEGVDNGLWHQIDNENIPEITLPPEITIKSSKIFLTSIYDKNYLPYSKPTSSAIWDRDVNPDARDEDKTIDYQGIINGRGMYVEIPAKIEKGRVEIPEFIQKVRVPAYKTEDGMSKTLVLHILKGGYSEKKHIIRARLYVEDGSTLNIKKLDLNAGLGQDYQGVELAKFSFIFNYSNDRPSEVFTFEVRATPGIPDKNIGKKTTIRGVEGYNHQFVYTPIMGPDGKMWLNNNLGADYSNINSEHFSPSKQAGGDKPKVMSEILNDKRAYGSLFQWLRAADGHELVRWEEKNDEDRFSEWQREYWEDPDTEPDHSKFIQANGGTFWKSALKKRHLQNWKANGSTNPCPFGFHVPSVLELKEAMVGDTENNPYVRWDSDEKNFIRTMRIPDPGKRYHNGGAEFKPKHFNNFNMLWTSTFERHEAFNHENPETTSQNWAINTYTWMRAYGLIVLDDIAYRITQAQHNYIADGVAVRCIQDEN